MDRVLSERRTDGPALDHLQGNGQGACFELDDEIFDFGRRYAFDDSLRRDGAVDRRRRDDMLVDDDRHGLAEVTARVLEKLTRGVALQLKSDNLIHSRVAGRDVGILEVSAADDGFVDRASWGASVGDRGCRHRSRAQASRRAPTASAPTASSAGPSVVLTSVPGGRYCPSGSMISSSAVCCRIPIASCGSSTPGSSTMT